MEAVFAPIALMCSANGSGSGIVFLGTVSANSGGYGKSATQSISYSKAVFAIIQISAKSSSGNTKTGVHYGVAMAPNGSFAVDIINSGSSGGSAGFQSQTVLFVSGAGSGAGATRANAQFNIFGYSN